MAISNQDNIEGIVAQKEVTFIESSERNSENDLDTVIEPTAIGTRRRLLLWLCCWLSVSSLILLSAAYSTQHWLEADPERIVDAETLRVARNVSETRFRGTVQLGLLRGSKILDNGLGQRTYNVDMFNEINNSQPALLSHFIWSSVLLLGCVAAGSLLLASITSAANAVRRRPVLGCSGDAGLLIWCPLALLCTLLASLLFLTAFVTSLSSSLMTARETQLLGWTSHGRARLGASYFLLLASAACNMTSSIAALLAGARPWHCCFIVNWCPSGGGCKADRVGGAQAHAASDSHLLLLYY